MFLLGKPGRKWYLYRVQGLFSDGSLFIADHKACVCRRSIIIIAFEPLDFKKTRAERIGVKTLGRVAEIRKHLFCTQHCRCEFIRTIGRMNSALQALAEMLNTTPAGKSGT